MCYSFISAYVKLPNPSCHFLKHNSVYLKILHQSLVSSKVTPFFIFFFNSNIIHFGQRSQLNNKLFRFWSVPVKRCQISHVSFQMTSQFSLLFASFFIADRHNCSVILSSYIFYFIQKDPIKIPSLTLSSVLVKISHMIF